MATWLGGAKGRSFREMVGVLRRYQLDHPTVRLKDLLREDYSPQFGTAKAQTDALKATGAMFVDAVYRERGTAGLVALNKVARGEDATLEAMRQELPRYASDLNQWWRMAAAQ